MPSGTEGDDWRTGFTNEINGKRYVANKVPDSEYAGGGSREADPILSLRGLGKAMRAGEEADACVERLREGRGRAGSSGTRNARSRRIAW